MTKKNEVKPVSESGFKSSVFNRRAFVGSLIAVFAALNVWLFGKRNRWWNPKYEVIVAGPFVDDVPVSVEHAGNDFVIPKSIRLDGRNRSQIKVAVEFEFKGEKRSDRRMELQLTALDANNRTIGGYIAEVGDMRLDDKKFKKFGAYDVVHSRINSVSGKVPKPENGTSGISQVVLRFVDFKSQL